MYDPDNEITVFNENEKLYDRVTHIKLLDLIKHHKVISCNIDSNSFGEFLFIELLIQNSSITFYSLGYHDLRDEYLLNHWHFYTGNSYNSSKHLNKKNVLKLINDRFAKISNLNFNHKRSKRGYQFSEIADIFGDDTASLYCY